MLSSKRYIRFGFLQRCNSASVGLNKAERAVETYLKGGARSMDQQNAWMKWSIPRFIPGRSGLMAMKLFNDISDQESDAGKNIPKMNKALKRTQLELQVFSARIRGDESWVKFTSIPQQLIPEETRNNYFKSIIDSLGCSHQFYEYLLPYYKNGQISKLDQLTVDFVELHRAHKREIEITLYTEKALSPFDAEYYKNCLRLDFLDPEDNLTIFYEVDPTIRGGYRVKIEDKVHDFTHTNAIEDSQSRAISILNEEPTLSDEDLAYNRHLSSQFEMYKDQLSQHPLIKACVDHGLKEKLKF